MRILISIVLLSSAIHTKAQVDLSFAYGMHSPLSSANVSLLNAEYSYINSYNDNNRRFECLVSFPLRSFRLEAGLSYIDIDYQASVLDTERNSSDFFHGNSIYMLQVPVRVAKRFNIEKWLTISPLAGVSLSYNSFDDHIQSFGITPDNLVKIGIDNRYDIYKIDEKRADFTVSADLGIRSEIKIQEDIWFYVAGLYQRGINELQKSSYSYDLYDTTTEPITFISSTRFDINKTVTNFSINFGLRFILSEVRTEDIKD